MAFNMLRKFEAKQKAGEKTPYQQNVAQPVENKWYKGDQPTTREVVGQLIKATQQDNAKGVQLQNDFRTLQQDNTSMFYAPYIKPTNQAVGRLAEMGLDVSKIDDDWFKNNKWLEQYNVYTANTNSLSSTMTNKKASPYQKMAYEYNQVGMAHELTTKAKTEWAALQEEVTYLAKDLSKNYSDDDIVDMIYGEDFAKKYPTLKKMDDSLTEPGQKLLELNEGIDYSRDALYGVIWAARNKGGTGNIWQDMGWSALGEGKTWKENPEVRTKLNENDPNFSPYEVGMSKPMEAAGKYFGTYEFTREKLDEIAANPHFEDKTWSSMYAAAEEGYALTQKLKEEETAIYKDVDGMLRVYSNPDEIIKIIKSNDDYKELFALDDTLDKKSKNYNKLLPTTSPVDYRWEKVEKYIKDKCHEKKAKAGALESMEYIQESAKSPRPRRYVGEGKMTHYEGVTTSQPYEDTIGQFGLGNIDLNARPVIQNDDGSISTLVSMSFYDDDPNSKNFGKEVLIPTAVNGKIVSEEDAIEHYYESGEFLGAFDTPEDANAYAEKLSEREGWYYNAKGEPANPTTPPEVNGVETALAPKSTVTTAPGVNFDAPKINPVPLFSDAEKAVEQDIKNRLIGLEPVIQTAGTDGEKLALETGKTNFFQESMNKIISMLPEKGNTMLTNTFNTNITGPYVNSSRGIAEYENHQNNLAELQMNVQATDEEYQTLKDKIVTPELVNLSSEELTGLNTLMENGDYEGFKEILNNPDTNQYDRDLALQFVYENVTGDYGSSNIDLIREKGQQYWDAIQKLEVAEIPTEEEITRYDTLNAWRQEQLSKMAEEENWLRSNDAAYNANVRDRDMATLISKFAGFSGADVDGTLIPRIDYLISASQQATNIQRNQTTYYDYMVDNGKMTRDDANVAAGKMAVNDYQAATLLRGTLGELQNAGVEFSEEELKNINSLIDGLEYEAREAAYTAISGNEDYNEMITKGLEEARKDPENIQALIAMGAITPDDVDSETLVRAPLTHPKEWDSMLGNMSLQERFRYLYLYGKDGKEAANKYLDFITDEEHGGTLYIRTMEGDIKRAKEFASRGPLEAAAGTAVSILAKPFVTLNALAYRAKGGDNPWHASLATQSINQNLREGSKKYLEKVFGDGTIATRFYDIGTVLGDIWYSSKITDAFASMYKDSGVGKALEEMGIKAGTAKNVATMVPLSIESANQAYQNVLFTTNDVDKANEMAGITFVADMISQQFVIKGIHNIAGTAAKNLSSNITKVLATTLTNTGAAFASTFATEKFKDYEERIILEEDSKYGQLVKKYESFNYSDSMAKEAAEREISDNIWARSLDSAYNAMLRTGLTYAASRYKAKGGTQQLVKDAKRVAVSAKDAAKRGMNQLFPEQGEDITFDASEATILDENGNPVEIPPSGFIGGETQVPDENLPTATTAEEYWQTAVTQANEGAASKAIQMMQKDTSVLMSTYNANPTAASVSIASVLGEKNQPIGMAAGQNIVGKVAGGDPKLASQSVQSLLLNGLPKDDLSYAALTNGEGRAALDAAVSALNNGQQITPADVKAISDGLSKDRKNDPKGFQQGFISAVKDTMISNKTIGIMLQNGADKDIEKANAAVEDKKNTLATTQKTAEDARSGFVAAGDSMKLAESQYDPSVPDTAADLQHATAHYIATGKEVKQADQNVEIAQTKVEQAQQEAERVATEALAQARPQAVSEVEQETADIAQNNYNNAVASLTPIKDFGRSIEAYDTDGNPLRITGIYEYIAPHRGTTGDVIYTTEDGRLVMENNPYDRVGNFIGDTPGAANIGDLGPEDRQAYYDALNDVQTWNVNRQRKADIRPVVDIDGVPMSLYLPISFPVNVDGQQVQMIGVVGKEISQDEEYPVIMGLDGKLYGGADENFDIPFESFYGVYDIFDKYQDKLPVIEDVTRITREGVNDATGQEAAAVPGSGTEGNNEGQLAGQLGQPVGFGDNGNAEQRSETPDVGGLQESVPGGNGSADSRRDKVFRSLITSHIPTDEEGKHKTVDDPHVQDSTDYQRFSDSLSSSIKANPYGLYVDPQSVEQLEEKGAVVCISPDGNSGFAVATKGPEAGNIFAVFNNPNGTARGTMPYLMTNALARGGNKLDCYDGFLSKQYAKYGFIPVAKTPFNIEYAPEGWDVKKFGTPDVVVWMHNGDSPETVAQKYGVIGEENGGYKYYSREYFDNLPMFTDTFDENGEFVKSGYDQAIEYRDGLLANRDHGNGLVYTHGLSPTYYRIALESGGIAGPSVGITKAGQKSSVYHFGEERGNDNVIILLNESSIDPEKEGNYLLGEDAFTEMFPENIERQGDKFINIDTGEEVSREEIAAEMAAKALTGGIVKQYKTLGEMKDDSGRLVPEDSEALGMADSVDTIDNAAMALYDSLSDEQKDQWAEKSKPSAGEDPADVAKFNLSAAINENFSAVYRPSMSTEEVQEALSVLGIDVSIEAAEAFRTELDTAMEYLTDYFEAKLMRDVPTQEWAGVVLPKSETYLQMMTALKGIPFLTYDGVNTTREGQVQALRNQLDQIANSKTPLDDNGSPIITPPAPPEEPPQITEAPVSEPPATPQEAPPVTEQNVNPPAREGGPEMGYRQWNVEGAQESDILHQEVKDRLLNDPAYKKDHNEEQLDRALSWISDHATQNDPTGFYGALQEIESDGFNLWSADGQVRLMTMIKMAAANSQLDIEARLSDSLFAKTGTDLGQAMQARKIWLTLTPEGRRESMERECSRINAEYQARGFKVNLHVSPETLDMAANAQSEAEFEEARRTMERELAAQIPSDWRLKMRVLRMTAMLANPRTHIRNLEGNGIFALFGVEAKNAIGTALEHLVNLPVGSRTKSIHRTPESVEFAKNDMELMMDELQGTAKYYEVSAVESERARNAFGSKDNWVSQTIGKGFQRFSNWTSDMLEKEDKIFLGYHYVRALSGYMTANGYTEADMKGNILNQARAYALVEAQKATYRDANTLAKWLNNPGNKWAEFTIGAVMPFIKTPANITRRGIEYSPIGLVSAAATAKKQIDNYNEWEKSGFEGPQPRNAKSPAEVIDKLSSGLTGLGIAALGAWLVSMGALKVKATDSEKREGSQDYSLELFGKSIGIGSATPVNIALFMGAQMRELATDESGEPVSFGKVLSTLSEFLEPIVDTTMMSGLNSLLDVSRYSGGGDLTMSTLVQKILANYVASYVPSAIGAIAKIVDPVKRKAFVKSGDDTSIWTAMIEQTQNKIPFLSMNNVPYLNAWGEKEGGTDVLDYFNAFMQNIILPDKVQDLKESELDDILAELSKTGINTEPSVAGKTIAMNGENIKLTDQQWYQYAEAKGQISKQTLQELIERPEFICLSDLPEVQANLVKDVYKYATAKAALQVFPEKNINEVWVREAIKNGNPIDAIFEKEEQAAKNEFVKDHKAKLNEAIDSGNRTAAMTDVQYLRQAGVKDSSIKTSITEYFKPIYKEADEYEREDIRNLLKGLDLGYEKYNFNNWLKD